MSSWTTSAEIKFQQWSTSPTINIPPPNTPVLLPEYHSLWNEEHPTAARLNWANYPPSNREGLSPLEPPPTLLFGKHYSMQDEDEDEYEWMRPILKNEDEEMIREAMDSEAANEMSDVSDVRDTVEETGEDKWGFDEGYLADEGSPNTSDEEMEDDDDDDDDELPTMGREDGTGPTEEELGSGTMVPRNMMTERFYDNLYDLYLGGKRNRAALGL